MAAAMMVHVALGKRGAEPADQRTPAAVGLPAGSVFRHRGRQAVELGVKLVGQVAAQRVAAGDGNRRRASGAAR